MKPSVLTHTLLIVAALAFGACGDDSSTKTGDAGNDAGGQNDAAVADKDAATPGKDAGGNAKDAGNGNDAGNADDAGGDAGNGFQVPAGGGTFHFMTSGGVDVAFKFPANAGGKDITVTPVAPGDVTWGVAALKNKFSDAIELGPKGTQFSTPVEVTVGSGSLLVFNFSDPKKPADPLLLSANGKVLLLTHFSTLGIVDPNNSCGSTGGWNDDAADTQSMCTGQGTATTYRSYGCKNYMFCYVVEAACCVPPGNTNTDCQVGDKALTLKYTRTDSNGGQYPYCDLAGGTGSLPYIQDVNPAMLLANSTDQDITVTGTGFEEGGAVMWNLDQAIATTFVSATKVTATVPGANLNSVSAQFQVRYVNKKADAAGDCNAASPSNCDFVGGASNNVFVPVQ